MKLKLENVKKTYGMVQALKGINYTFEPGIYGILGANGAGKSTMINLITDNVARDGRDIRNSTKKKDV
ncbi:MAG: AAA family ATPase [Eubacteriales bacterium]|nr:AAA family ATPase [Eubacteriales bacterium]